MAAVIKVYHAVDLTVDGVVVESAGSMLDPIKTATLTGDGKRRLVRPLVIPADDSDNPGTDGVITAWTWDQTQGFEYLAIVVRGSGFLRVAYRVEPVTSEADQTPTGASKMWHHRSASCIAPCAFDSDRVLHNAVSADVTGDTADIPTLFTDAGTVDGVISRIVLWNEDTEDDVLADLYVVGE